MLLVLGAEPAIERAAVLRFNCKPGRHLPGRKKLIAIEPPGIATHEIFADTVCWAVLAEVHAPMAIHDFCWHQADRRRGFGLVA
jgi:hypothetical protein